MPLYVYRCPSCGYSADVFKRIANLDRAEKCFKCQTVDMERLISAPRILGDYEAYDCPVTGKRIEGRKAHRENLARQGCRILEPGEKEAVARNRQRADRELEAAVDATVEQEIHSMSADKRDRLAAELQHGVSVDVVRQ